MMIEHCDFPLFHLTLFSACSILYLVVVLFHFVDKQVATVYKQMGLLGPCRALNKQLASQHWTKDFREHAQGWLKKEKKELANSGQQVLCAFPHALGP